MGSGKWGIGKIVVCFVANWGSAIGRYNPAETAEKYIIWTFGGKSKSSYPDANRMIKCYSSASDS